jgi:phosphopantothenoylcysteine decarboxylase/phosphopantothenate--cysteine ligase
MVNVTTAQEMLAAVIKAVKSADALIMAAAVADYRPVQASESKIKRQKAEQLTLKLVRTPDILATVKGKFLRVGFAAETDNLERNAREKLARKKLDLIVANDVKADEVFGADTNRAVIIDRNGKVERLPVLAKRELADRILDHAVGLLPDSRKPPAHPSTECGPLTP